MGIIEDIKRFVDELNEVQKERFKVGGYVNECFFDGFKLTAEYTFKSIEKKKYIYIDCGTSGWFMVVRDTGEIFGIKGYGKINKGRYYGRVSEVSATVAYKSKLGGYY